MEREENEGKRRYVGVGLKLEQIEKFLALLSVSQLHKMTL